MILIAVVVGIASLSWMFDMPNKLSPVSLEMHLFCLRSLPHGVENLDSLEALVCGKNMQDLQFQHLLMQTSLIHIFIVSGSHFIFLHKILAKVFGKSAWLLFVLGLYAMVTLCQPPSVRSLLFLVLCEISARKKWSASKLQLVGISALTTLAFFPQWITSRSFLMSLMAALAMTVASEFMDRKMSEVARAFWSQSFMYFAMGFCLWGFSNLHPLSIVFNILLGSLIGGLLFPLGFIAVILPFTTLLFDQTLDALRWVLQTSAEVLKDESAATPLQMILQWSVLVLILVLAHPLTVHKKRRAYDD